MFSPNIYLFLIGLCYVFILQAFSLILISKRRIIKPQNQWLFIFFLSLMLRFIPAYFLPFASSYDVSAFRWAAGRVYEQKDIYYSFAARHSYAFLPTFAMVISEFIKISNQTGIPFLFFEKLPIILSDSLIAVFIHLITGSFKLALIYSVSPIPIIIGAFLGQFDSITLLFVILGLFLFSQKKFFFSMISLGVATIFKPWGVIFTPLIFFKQKKILAKIKLIIGFMTPLILIISFYKLLIPQVNLLVMVVGPILYTSVVGWWGLSIFLKPIFDLYRKEIIYTLPAQISKILVVSLILLVSQKLKIKTPFYLAKLIILIIYIFSFGLSTHYLLWIFPLALITKDNFVRYYILFVGGYLLLFGFFGALNYNFQPPFTPPILYLPLSFLLWSFFLFWGIKEVRLLIRNYIFG